MLTRPATRLRPAATLLFALLACLLGMMQPVHAQETGEPASLKDLSPRAQAIWNRHWPLAARNYIIFNEEYLCVRGYNDRYPSSKGMTVTDLLKRDKGYVMRLRNRRGMTIEQRITLSRVEAEAMAMALPQMAVGHYGFIHSVEVERILGPDAMVVRNLWLIDAQAMNRARDDDRQRLTNDFDWNIASQIADELYQNRVRLADMQQQAVFNREFVLRGFPTERLASGMRWAGPGGAGLQIAILSVQDVEDNWSPDRGVRRMLVAIPGQRLRNGLNRDQFLDLLARRKMTPQQLVEVVEEANRSVVRDVEKSMVDAIEAADPAPKTDVPPASHE